MNKASVLKRFELVFTAEEINRISFDMDIEEIINAIKVDVHGLKCAAARRLINNIINIIRDAFRLIIIHGFNHGTAIKEMLRNEFYNHKVDNMFGFEENRGVTYMVIHSGCV